MATIVRVFASFYQLQGGNTKRDNLFMASVKMEIKARFI